MTCSYGSACRLLRKTYPLVKADLDALKPILPEEEFAKEKRLELIDGEQLDKLIASYQKKQ